MNSVLAHGTAANRTLRAGLVGLALIAIGYGWWRILEFYPLGVDLTIPLRAAERWLAGGTVYDPAAFAAAPGPTQPFLYPPIVLLPLAPLVALPRDLVLAAWCTACLLAGVATCRRLGIPPRWWVPVLAWPPFAEGILGGNVQVILFALFAFVFWSNPDRLGWQPHTRSLERPEAWPRASGAIGALSAMVKLSQPHLWLFALRRRPRQAVAGAAIVTLVTILAVLVTGPALWADWLAQLDRATDPSWDLGGIALPRFLGLAGTAVAIAGALACLVLRPSQAGVWIGLLSVIGATSLHTFGLLFLVPAMLLIRREIALFAAILIATFTYPATWLAIVAVGAAWVAGERFDWLRENDSSSVSGDPRLGRPRTPVGVSALHPS